nr:mitogen-activated protein kinase kinase kinase NPK1-like [Ipomoea batatas]
MPMGMSLYGGDAEEEEELEGEESPAAGSRRSLFWHTMRYYISYGALSANRIPCPPRSGRSYYTHNCHVATGPVRPYFRDHPYQWAVAIVASHAACGSFVGESVTRYGEKAQSKKGGCGLWPCGAGRKDSRKGFGLTNPSFSMDWVRGETVGHGSFGKVSLANPRNSVAGVSPAMVVKSCSASRADSLLNEKRILDELQGCPEIVRCFGDSYSFEKGEKLYNVLLEFASRGSLADKIKDSGDYRLSEFEIRGYAKALLRGLRFIHETGYVHCDVKLENILLGEDGRIRIADFGLAKRCGEGESFGWDLRGTPMYMSPEMVAGG